MSEDKLSILLAALIAVWKFAKSPKAGWILSAITIFLSLFLIVNELRGVNTIDTIRGVRGNKSGQSKSNEDPLGIAGVWTYTTSFSDNNDSKKHKYKAVKGVNFLITFNGCGYTMQGKRTHYEEWNSNTFQEYPSPIPIKISRTGFTSDPPSFYFYFEVQGSEDVDQSVGFVELQIDKSNKSKIEGIVHYLYNDRTWSKTHITFERQQ